MHAGAVVPNRAGPLAVACESERGEGVEWGAFRAAGEQRLADARAAEDRLERPHVQVLARVRAGHHGELRRREVEFADAVRLQERHERERLDARPQRDDRLRIAGDPDHRAGRVDLDDMTAMDAFHDLAADVAGQDRRCPARRNGGAGPSAARGADGRHRSSIPRPRGARDVVAPVGPVRSSCPVRESRGC